jgi:hypothetical protein
MANLLLSAHYRRILSPAACINPLSPNCSVCTSTELTLGTCGALADNFQEARLGLVTAWGMFVCFLIPIIGFLTRRTRIVWAGFAPLIAIIIAAILQEAVPSVRPPGACMADGTTCGMPSGHVITAYATITFLFCMWGRDLVLDGVRACFGQLFTLYGIMMFFVVGAFVIVQILMPLGRFYLKYHTEAQVGFGVLTGVLIGLTWFLIVLKFVGPKVGPWLEKHLKCLRVYDDWNASNRKVDLPTHTAALASTDAKV